MAILIGGSTNTILSTTWANKPASYPVGQSVFITNAGTKGSHWFYDGTSWKPVNGLALLASLDSASSNIANTETIVFQYLLPAGLVQTGDRLRLSFGHVKSGTTDGVTFTTRLGAAGTTSDTALTSISGLSASLRQTSSIVDFRLESATSMRMMPNSRVTAGYGTTSAAAWDAAVTISSASANALYFSVGLAVGGTTDTANVTSAELFLISKAN